MIVQNAEIAEGHPDKSFGEISRLVSERWKIIPTELKDEYEAKAREDKARYQHAMANYEPPTDDNGPPKKRKRRKKDPSAPKKNSSAFLFFSQVCTAGTPIHVRILAFVIDVWLFVGGGFVAGNAASNQAESARVDHNTNIRGVGQTMEEYDGRRSFGALLYHANLDCTSLMCWLAAIAGV